MSASVALAFGGSRDIGAAIALRLAKGDFDVALTYLSRPDQAIDTVSALVQREERIVAAFEEIQRFVEKHGRAPQHGEDRDIFERLYAVRLDRLRGLEECRFLLVPLDHQGLLIHKEITAAGTTETLDDDEVLAELQGAPGAGGITELRHVRKIVDKRTAEEIANRSVSGDFEKFKPIFEQVKRDLKSGVRPYTPRPNYGRDQNGRNPEGSVLHC